MSFMPFEGGEPIPGYQLLNRLGTGGFGEVWKVTAPGGLAKAIKIVYGHMNEARAEQELRALSRIKEVRHPFLLSLERFEILDGQLFIVTELADSSLFERFQACRASGERGIPRDELLAYFRDAADALDYMASHYGLQHLDVKPQNLLLVGGRIKVADFGLVKDLQGTSVTATGGVTPIYAPPEAFDGRISRFSDQYSLAVVYQEMLTGVRPFPGTTAYQLAAQHTTSPPMLDPLPFQDRAVIGRALAKLSDERFSSCREMVDHLEHGLAAPVAAHQTAPTPPSTRVSTGVADAAGDQAELLNVDTEVAVTAFSPAEVRFPTPPDKLRLTPPLTMPLRPTLFLGVGGLAGQVLRHLRRRLHKRFGSLAAVPVFRMLLLDADRLALQQMRDGKPGEALTAGETLNLPLFRPEHYRDRSRELLRWLDRRWLYNIPRSLLTEGLRPLGRLAFVDNAVDLLERLREIMSQLASAEAKESTVRATGLTVSPEPPCVFLVASLSGSTGGGMINDLA
jgi:eukaryotic-like serine/threonine-protein kinase